MKKLLSSILLLAILISCLAVSAYADSSLGDNIRFVPTHITVSKSDVVVEGFFINLNKNHEVGNFKDYEMAIYKDGKEIADSSFGEINQFMIPPMSFYFQRFRYSSDFSSSLTVGEYDCDDSYYAVIGANFSSSKSNADSCSTYNPTAANTSVSDLIRFVPTCITVSTSKTVVEGYFLNLTYDRTVSNFREFDMTVYEDGDKLLSGDFGTIHSFSIDPLRALYQSFTFNGDYTDDLTPGTHVCGDDVTVSFGCRFSSKKS